MKIKNLSKLVLVLLIGLVSAQSKDEIVIPSTTEAPVTEPTTASIITTTMAPPTTPTAAPTTTTAPPTPPPTTPSTTTAAPTTMAPTTVAPPTVPTTARPVPEPSKGLWMYKDETTNQTCVIVQLAVQLNLTYVTSDNQNKNIKYDLPINETKVASGSCDPVEQNILIEWGNSQNKSSLMMTFAKNTTTKMVSVTEIVFQIIVGGDDFPNAKDNQTLMFYNTQDLFDTPEATSYYCTKPQVFNLTNAENSNTTVAFVQLSHSQIEAYHTKKDVNFSTARDCDSIDTPDIVPITVGCALAALVVIVLIAYLVGRRRALQRGYTSM